MSNSEYKLIFTLRSDILWTVSFQCFQFFLKTKEMGWWRLLFLHDAGGSIASCSSQKQDDVTETSGREQIVFPTSSLWTYAAVPLSQRWSF